MISPIRLPNRDVVQIASELTDTGVIEQYLFNDIGGTELINLVRNDSVTGIKTNYTIISNLVEQDSAFDPTFLLLNKTRYQSEFDRYAIKLSSKIPEENFYEENDVKPPTNIGTNTYYDVDTESLVIELDGVNTDTEFVQIEVLTAGRIYSMRENDYK